MSVLKRYRHLMHCRTNASVTSNQASGSHTFQAFGSDIGTEAGKQSSYSGQAWQVAGVPWGYQTLLVDVLITLHTRNGAFETSTLRHCNA